MPQEVGGGAPGLGEMVTCATGGGAPDQGRNLCLRVEGREEGALCLVTWEGRKGTGH